MQALLIYPVASKAKPELRVWVSKDGKPLAKDKSKGLPLGIPSMGDRALQALREPRFGAHLVPLG